MDEPDEDGPLAWEGRVFAVAVAWALPGVLAGLLAGLFLSAAALTDPWGPTAVGGAIGMLAGGLLEAG